LSKRWQRVRPGLRPIPRLSSSTNRNRNPPLLSRTQWSRRQAPKILPTPQQGTSQQRTMARRPPPALPLRSAAVYERKTNFSLAPSKLSAAAIHASRTSCSLRFFASTRTPHWLPRLEPSSSSHAVSPRRVNLPKPINQPAVRASHPSPALTLDG